MSAIEQDGLTKEERYCVDMDCDGHWKDKSILAAAVRRLQAENAALKAQLSDTDKLLDVAAKDAIEVRLENESLKADYKALDEYCNDQESAAMGAGHRADALSDQLAQARKVLKNLRQWAYYSDESYELFISGRGPSMEQFIADTNEVDALLSPSQTEETK